MSLVRDFFYLVALIVYLPILLWQRFVKGKKRGGFAERFGGVARRDGDKPCLWVHGVSVGEVQAARPIVEGWRRRHPDWDIVVSTTTDTGFAAAGRAFPDALVIRYPADFSFAVRRSLSRIRPTLVVLMELEVWPNFISIARARGTPVVIANGRISDRSFPRSRRLRFLLAGSYSRIASVAAQTEEYASRFTSLGVPRDRVVVAGSLKYDAVPSDVPDPAPLARESGLAPGEKVLVAGSTTPGEEEILLDVYARLTKEFPRLRLVIVPRHPERFDAVAQLIRSRGLSCVRRSETKAKGAAPAATLGAAAPVILGDTMGELMRFYSLASVVFVGKSLVSPGGGQNMIEPAALGKPVVFGRWVSNFQETRDRLVAADAAVEVDGPEELFTGLKRLLADDRLAMETGERARKAVEAARGVVGRTLDLLEVVLAKTAPPG